MIILYVFLLRDPADKIQTEAFKLGLPEAEQRKMSQLAGKPPLILLLNRKREM
jgi:hypothetical protein